MIPLKWNVSLAALAVFQEPSILEMFFFPPNQPNQPGKSLPGFSQSRADRRLICWCCQCLLVPVFGGWFAHCPTSSALIPYLLTLSMALESHSVAGSEDKVALYASSVPVTATAPGSHRDFQVHLRPAGFRSNFPNYQSGCKAAILVCLPVHSG